MCSAGTWRETDGRLSNNCQEVLAVETGSRRGRSRVDACADRRTASDVELRGRPGRTWRTTRGMAEGQHDYAGARIANRGCICAPEVPVHRRHDRRTFGPDDTFARKGDRDRGFRAAYEFSGCLGENGTVA